MGSVIRRFWPALLLASLVGMASAHGAAVADSRVATVADPIGMTRIQDESAAGGAMAAISPDGRTAAFVTWRGDLRRNTNIYELRLIRLDASFGVRQARVLLTRDYPGDRIDPDASPIKQLSFVHKGRSLAYLGLDDKGVAQVYMVDIGTGVVRQLTHHPTSVRNFVVGPQGHLLAYSAVAFPQDNAARRIKEDGVFLWDTSLFPDYQPSFPAGAMLSRLGGWNGIRQYFLAGTHPRLIFDSRQSRPSGPDDDPTADVSPTQSLADDSAVLMYASLSADPSGKHLLMYPYQVTAHPLHPRKYAYYRKPPMNAYARRVAAQVAEIDVDTGRITPLVDAPSPQFEVYESGSPLWSPDGRSILLYTLFPDQPERSPAWVEMSVSTRRLTPLGLAKDWKPVGWTVDGKGLVLAGKGGRFAIMRRGADGRWLKPEAAGDAKGFYPDWQVATDGKLILGVEEGLKSPPELAAYVPGATGPVRLTDLNPQLRKLRLGEVVPYRWRKQAGSTPDGFLVKPVGYRPGKRYPLVLLLDDAVLWPQSPPYLLDATVQLSGDAIQMLAGQGFMVLYYHDPAVADVVETPEEPRRVCRDVEKVIAQLDREGLIDPSKIGVSGWSRAGFYTMYLLIHSTVRFAAASNIDGGTTDYTDRMRPFTDKELNQIRTPLLFEPHGLWSLVDNGQIAARMHAFGEPIEILYFDSAPHQTIRPQHRWRSLQTEIDWWNFWLRGRIDPDPAKARQYKHWQQLKTLQNARDEHP